MKKYFLLLVLAFSSMFASAQIDKIVGEWYTVDDETGAIKALVNIYQGDNGLYYGQIVKAFKDGVENAMKHGVWKAMPKPCYIN